MRPESVVRGAAVLRVGIGALLTSGTVPFLRVTVRNEARSGALLLFARTVGIHDLVFGAACFSALRGGDRRDVRRWLSAWLVNELADAVAGMAAARHVGRGGAVAAAVTPLPFVAVDIWALRRLSGVLANDF